MPKNSEYTFFDDFYHWLDGLLADFGLQNHEISKYIMLLILLLLLGITVFFVQYISRYLLRIAVDKIANKTKLQFFKYLRKRRFPHYVALIPPVIMVFNALPFILVDFRTLQKMAIKLLEIYIVFMIIWIIMSSIKAFFDVLRERPAFKYKPMDSWSQVISIILMIVGVIFSYTILTGKDIITLMGYLGAISAVLLLVFKDTIMGFVASITVATNDMVRLGDWITMPEYNADGDVVEINLNTVKVQNFDKTITTIPTYKLIQNSFQNWRGMQNSGGRRIKRSINIIQSTVRFVRDSEIERFTKIQGIAEYIHQKSEEIKTYNEQKNVNKEIPVNGRNFTNLGLFRKYAQSYLENHPNIDKNKTLLVRQLSPTPKGIPIEVYTFTSTTVWADYEDIQSDIFDHLIAAVRYFDLDIFEDLHNDSPFRCKETHNPE